MPTSWWKNSCCWPTALWPNTSQLSPKGKQPKVLPYRIHDVPDPEKLEKLRGFVAKFGYKVRTEGTKTEISHALNDLLGEVKGRRRKRRGTRGSSPP